MTDHDVTEFATLLRGMGEVHGKKTEALTAAYFEALRDIPLEVVRQAKTDLVAKARFWPKPVDWRAAAQKIEGRHVVPLPQRREVLLENGTTEDTYYCASCEDTGWRPVCGCAVGLQDIRGHCVTHGGHEQHGVVYRQPVIACVCRATNPLWQFHHQTKRVEAERVRTDG